MDDVTNWRRSSYCGSANCAEIRIDSETVLLRNSKLPDSTVELSKEEWEALRLAILNGEF